MGNKSSKKEKNDELKKIGEDANKSSPLTFSTFSQINLTNDLIIGKFKSDPEEDYKKLNFLGEGAFASVYKVENRYTEAICAMKVIRKNNSCTLEDENEILNEINILKTMDHPGILKLFEFYSNKQTYSIVTELCPGGELFQQILDKGPFKEKYTAFVMYQIFSAVNYCHQMHIIHRDLKPENILIVGKEKDGLPIIKLCDFGTSRIFEKGTFQKKVVGSSYYIAPEVLKKHYNEKCDIWSCGVILYVLLSGTYPFNGKNDQEISKKILNGKFEFNSILFKNISNEAKDLIKKCLIYDKNERISAIKALKHPFFTNEINLNDLYNENINCKNILLSIKNFSFSKHSKLYEIVLSYLSANKCLKTSESASSPATSL
jgi:calcium-dependent protein kinase